MNHLSMLHFIQNLYQQYGVLNKLNEKESNDFQREIVVLLVDGDENVDQEAYSKHTKKGGIEGLILELLAKVMQRNPFKNQFELNKNLAILTEKFKKDQEQLIKKQKILQRKEQKLKNIEDSLMNTIKTKINSLQSESFQKLLKKETEIKKNASILINQLKSKQKLVIEKLQEIKNKLKMVSDLENREKIINQKLKIVQRREKQLKNNNKDQLQQTKKDAEVQQYKQTIQKLKQSLKESSKKYKNLQLAYRKVKSIQLKHLQMKKMIVPKIQIRQKEIINELDELQFSKIEIPAKNQQCEQLINIIDFQEISSKLQKIISAICKQQNYEDTITNIKQILGMQKSNELSNQYQNIPTKKYQLESAQQELQEQLLPKCLTVQPIQQYSSIKSIAKTIKSIALQEDSQKLEFISGNKLQSLIKNCQSSKMSLQICETLLRKILELIEVSSHYEKIIRYLAGHSILKFFQQVYLSHQTNDQIIQAVTLILSRIKLKDHVIELSSNFVKSLNMRLKIESKDSFLYGNINYLLNQL